MSSMIKMNNAHDEKISFCPASGSGESHCQPSTIWGMCKKSTHHHLPDLPHHRSVVLYKMESEKVQCSVEARDHTQELVESVAH